jgi:SPP1 family predicted phage head-tail adaptor
VANFSGVLDRRLTIRRAALAPNAFNEAIETWSDYATVWAKRMDASANESYRAQEVGAEITARFTVRWSSQAATISPVDRVSFGGREYNITAVRDVGRNQWREIDAVARAQPEPEIEEGSP